MDQENIDGADLLAASLGGNSHPENKHIAMANSIVDLAVNTVLSKCVEKVLIENDPVMFDGMVEEADLDSDDDLLEYGGEEAGSDPQQLPAQGGVAKEKWLVGEFSHEWRQRTWA